MSQVYSTEPDTSGRVVFQTSHGPIDIQLWCKECPTTCRAFIQRCVDGFYDNMVWHRVVPNFLLQTGQIRHGQQQTQQLSNNTNINNIDPKQLLQAKAYQSQLIVDEEDRSQYELNARIRFSHRGQVAMALPLHDTSQTHLLHQFFVTMEEAPYLDGKHVIFGSVRGPTIFNALRIGNSTDVNEETGIPVDMEHPPLITSVTVHDHPFDDLLEPKRRNLFWKTDETSTTSDDVDGKKKKKKRKGKRDLNVLSFGNEMMEEDANVDSSSSRVQSLHDTTGTATRATPDNVGGGESTGNKRQRHENNEATLASTTGDAQSRLSSDQPESKNNEGKMLDEMAKNLEPRSSDAQPVKEDHANRPKNEENKRIKDSKAAEQSNTTSRPVISEVQARRAKYLSKKPTSKKAREEDTMARFLAFRTQVVKSAQESTKDRKHGEDNSLAARMARKQQQQHEEKAAKESDKASAAVRSYHGQALDDDEEDESSKGWMNTKFHCRKHMDITSRGGDGRDMSDYLVVDEKDGKNARAGIDRSHEHRKKNRSQHGRNLHGNKQQGGGRREHRTR